MALHIAEQILAAFLTTLSNLTTTEDRIERGRVYPIEENGAPALSIYMGSDTPPEPGDEGDNYPYLDCVLEVRIRIHSLKAGAVLDTELNLIRKEVVAALRATTKLGLASTVINFWEGPTAEPEISGPGARRSAQQDMTWYVKYRRTVTDPSTSS